jgi:hypothetical protein
MQGIHEEQFVERKGNTSVVKDNRAAAIMMFLLMITKRKFFNKN